MSFQVYHLFSQTILHCGSGQSVGIVDQPIARDRATHLPLVPGSTVRGVLRAHISQQNDELTNTLFGYQKPDSEPSSAGALSITDAHLLLLPVRTVYGILAYATCPFILQRYKKDLKLDLTIPTIADDQALYPNDNPNHQGNLMVLEDLDLTVKDKACEHTQKWAEHIAQTLYTKGSPDYNDMSKRIIVLPDTVFSFLAETATEIRTRIRIDQNTGVVDGGALWTEESLPAESVLWGVYSVDKTRLQDQNSDKLDKLNGIINDKPLLQMGGNMGTGNGLVQFIAQSSKGE
ncbi:MULTISPECIES: type III-B CRISPR module RAMP protein Cmr4 [Marinomonas]|uniref:Type III-B CRISPR module RAMP protein Cmr4 n=1 Tax=Marinomonas arctica TaxID=383750 RepID=A0A7H1J9Z7_9GAMM|nr:MULTISPECIES: type III-B CRISPR module RAMP protein Cmr4 [Marinomonas]MCS7488552.1 CRISPR-associated protein Cmr4 [Marinomonas sp. BSi20414]QNT07313.1 type III-B CRISPR module RAMP protein Cmr4 [Marinomonas arctica]GGN27611.1 type III-B CRISPR module RAMP protein Cmr4 [Marinomonas arctica]